MTDFIPVLSVEDLPAECGKAVSVNGKDILLCQTGGELYAVSGVCTHQQEPLAGGRVRRGHVACPLHGVRFNLKTGEPVGQLTRVPLKTYDVKVVEGVVHLSLGD